MRWAEKGGSSLERERGVEEVAANAGRRAVSVKMCEARHFGPGARMVSMTEPLLAVNLMLVPMTAGTLDIRNRVLR
jgi:hypothetical protein